MEKPPRYTDVQFCNRAILGCIAVREGECAQNAEKRCENLHIWKKSINFAARI